MWRYVARKAFEAIPVILGVASVSFLLVQFLPGSPAEAILGQRATPEAVAALNAQLGLDEPVWQQYGSYVLGLVRGDLGSSLISGVAVSEIVFARLPITMSLAIVAAIVSAVIGIGLGALAAVRGGWFDRALTALTGLGLAIPNFWLGVVSVLVFSIWLAWLPATGFVELTVDPAQWALHLVLPVAVLSVVQIAAIARQTRAAMLVEFTRDYVRSLRATGISRRTILWKHILRNASAPVVTTLGLQFVGVLGGSVIIEQVFGIRGLGSLMVESANSQDLPVLQGIVVLSAVIVLAVNLVVDIVALVLNPKVRPA